MSQDSSPIPRHLMVELVGPLVDDRGAMARTLGEVLRDRGVELRPGALDQVTGAAASWAIHTLLEGHGRGDLLEDADALLAQVARRWHHAATRAGAAPGAATHWTRLVQGAGRIAVFCAYPGEVGLALAAAAGLPDLERHLVDMSADGGPPRPERLVETIASWGEPASAVTAVVATAPAMLAALSARCGEVLLVGADSPQAVLLAERRLASLAEVGQ